MKSISTKQGDRGQTTLIGGQHVSKSHLRVEACGTLDELNSALGLARSFCEHQDIKTLVKGIQKELFVIGSSLAQKRPQNLVTSPMVDRLTEQVYYIESLEHLLIHDWAIAGEHPSSAIFDLARTICRRAERNIVHLQDTGEEIEMQILPYMNRLSDLLWLFGRWIEFLAGIDSRLHRDETTSP